MKKDEKIRYKETYTLIDSRPFDKSLKEMKDVYEVSTITYLTDDKEGEFILNRSIVGAHEIAELSQGITMTRLKEKLNSEHPAIADDVLLIRSLYTNNVLYVDKVLFDKTHDRFYDGSITLIEYMRKTKR